MAKGARFTGRLTNDPNYDKYGNPRAKAREYGRDIVPGDQPNYDGTDAGYTSNDGAFSGNAGAPGKPGRGLVR